MMLHKKFNPNSEKFELVCITEETIKKLLCCLDVSKGPGMDEISPRFLKDGTEVLAKPICDINLSIKLSAIPDKCKIAKLTPLFKKGSKTDPKNYRPISLLPLISKLIQKAINIKTGGPRQKWLNLQISIRFQEKFFNFLTDNIIKGMDKGEHTGMILIDLQKAFDTLDRNVLIKIMECVGFKKPVIKWFKQKNFCIN